MIIGGTWCLLAFNKSLETSKYVIFNKSINNETICISGFIVNSSMKYRKYSYSLLNNDLYIKIYGTYITVFDKPG